jgi:hypothetical protein
MNREEYIFNSISPQKLPKDMYLTVINFLICCGHWKHNSYLLITIWEACFPDWNYVPLYFIRRNLNMKDEE